MKRINFLLCLCAFVPLCFSQQTLKVEVNLVNVFATVQDESGNFIKDLQREDFRIYEDGEPQDIHVFEKQDQVDSVIGLLMDTSGSMVDILPFMRRGVRDFARAMPKSDEFFVATFGASVKLVHSASQTPKHLDDELGALRAYGTSVLFDALQYGIARVNRSERPRKALIVFTDGNDNGSRVSYARIVEDIQSSGLLVYFVAIGSPILVDSYTIDPLAQGSGGRTIYVGKQQEAIGSALEQIRTELSQQYYLGYYVTRKPGFHRIRVEVPGRNVRIRAKNGYVGGLTKTNSKFEFRNSNCFSQCLQS